VADDHGLTSSLISGYQLAFLAGAATIAAGTALAVLLLRPPAHAERRFAAAPAGSADAPATHDLDMEREAA